MEDTIVRALNLKKYYGQRLVLNVDELALEAGKIYSLVGPNGSGKTTLMTILSLLKPPSSGRIFFRGEEVNPKGDTLPYRRLITMVPQNPYLFKASVLNNVAYGLKVRGLEGKQIERRAMLALEMVGLEGVRDRSAGSLSGGEGQRLAIARALVLEPQLIFLDEPTANVDAENSEIIESLVRDMRGKKGATIMVSTHNSDQAFRLADQVLPMMYGRLGSALDENLWEGEIVEEGGEKFFLKGDLRVSVITARSGKAHISLDPQNILISGERIASSARNSLAGRIVKIEERGDLVKLVVDVGEDLVVHVTRRSFHEMGLTLGHQVYATFKSSSVKVF